MSIELHRLICGNCGVEHAIPLAMYNNAKREGGFWHCPNGHNRGWKEGTEKTEAVMAMQSLPPKPKRL